MGREVRRVTASWQHPKNAAGWYVPLHDGCTYWNDLKSWDEESALWAQGLRRDYGDDSKTVPHGEGVPFSEWNGERPDKADYMPVWTDAEADHLMMYESVSEGTPVSPAFKTPEELAHWLADNGASAFAGETASYEQWLRVCQGASAPSAAIVGGSMVSGVAFVSTQDGAD